VFYIILLKNNPSSMKKTTRFFRTTKLYFKKLLLPFSLLIIFFIFQTHSFAQCPGGYTQAQLNWDNMDVYFNSGGSSPYGNYINNTYEQSQRFSIGTTWMTMATSSAALINPGTGSAVTAENASHTGEITGYTGDDVQFNPSANGQNITFTFNDEVRNVQFTLYDVDGSQRIDFAAQNAALVAQTINVVTYASTILTITNNNATNAYITASSTTLGNTSNRGSATITVAGPVKTITITITTIGSDVVFWLSDINACVPGSFPTNWHQGFNNQPFSGFTQNQPDYFLVTPDNNSCYMMDPATGRCWWIFTDASKTYMNSYAYDPENKILYYISENASLNANNKELKKYDFNTETISTVIADIGTTLGIPTFNSGVESAGAAYYDGKLYIGMEGGQNTSNRRESIVWCIDLTTNTAYQVFATPSYDGSGITHDWADFLVKDGVLINYNSARRSTDYSYSSYTHFNMMTGADTRYMNPYSNLKYSGQAGMSWNGNMYMIYDSVWLYNNGVISSRQQITVVSVPGDPVPPAWAGNAGDASDPFRPKGDFGDAPASYDPNPNMPAYHERSEAIRLGDTWDREWLKKGVTGVEDTDDGLVYVPILSPNGSNTVYVAAVDVYNNSGANATLIAWLDYNDNGVFDASEACTPITVPSSASMQSFNLYWPAFTTPLTSGEYTFLRIRITAASAGMTAAHATGYFVNGEVEDYEVYVDNYPLSVTHLLFNAQSMNDNSVKLTWTATEEVNTPGYEIQRSSDSRNWEQVALIPGKGPGGIHSYEYLDSRPLKGMSYYRLRIIGNSGHLKYSEVKSVRISDLIAAIRLSPNPAKGMVKLAIQNSADTRMDVRILKTGGEVVYRNSYQVPGGNNEIEIALHNIPPGMYIVQVVSAAGEVVNKKLVIKN
jgi:energy-coupling factor transporter transmembrane protein EcfT